LPFGQIEDQSEGTDGVVGSNETLGRSFLDVALLVVGHPLGEKDDSSPWWFDYTCRGRQGGRGVNRFGQGFTALSSEGHIF